MKVTIHLEMDMPEDLAQNFVNLANSNHDRLIDLSHLIDSRYVIVTVQEVKIVQNRLASFPNPVVSSTADVFLYGTEK